MVVEGVVSALGLKNINPQCVRVETLTKHYDYAVSRAVTAMPEFVKWVWPLLERGQHGTLPNGILYLKGGDLAEELALTHKRWDIYALSDYFSESFSRRSKWFTRRGDGRNPATRSYAQDRCAVRRP